MNTSKNDMATKSHFSIHVPGLCEEILRNPGAQVLQKPLIMLMRLLGEVAQRAAEINDAKLNGLMADLTLYEVTDGYSKEYDAKLRQEIIDGKHGIDAAKAVNEHDALNAIAEAADNYRTAKAAYQARESSSGLCDVMNNCEDILFDKSAALTQLRKSEQGKVQP